MIFFKIVTEDNFNISYFLEAISQTFGEYNFLLYSLFETEADFLCFSYK